MTQEPPTPTDAVPVVWATQADMQKLREMIENPKPPTAELIALMKGTDE